MVFTRGFGQICWEFPWHYCVFSSLKIPHKSISYGIKLTALSFYSQTARWNNRAACATLSKHVSWCNMYMFYGHTLRSATSDYDQVTWSRFDQSV